MNGRSVNRNTLAWNQFIWTVRRELWGNRFLVVVPTALTLLSLLLTCMGLSKASLHSLDNMDPADVFRGATDAITHVAALSGMAVSCIYALGTFYNERKDLSILFWKSMPVSDFMSVLAKASIVLFAVPALVLVLNWISVITLSIAGRIDFGVTLAALTSSQGVTVMMSNYILYALINALWWFPVYGVLFVVSVLVRSIPAGWVLGVLAALGIAEFFLLNTSRITSTVWDRLFDSPGRGSQNRLFQGSYSHEKGWNIHQLTLQHSVPDTHNALDLNGLLIGIVVGIVCLALTIWLRRRAEPI